MSEYLIAQLDRTPNIRVRYRTEVIGGDGDRHLTQLTLRDADSATIDTVPAAGLFVLIGGRPRTDWLHDVVTCDPHGYVLTGVDVRAPAADRARFPYETSVAGVFAVATCAMGRSSGSRPLRARAPSASRTCTSTSTSAFSPDDRRLTDGGHDVRSRATVDVAELSGGR